MPEKIIEPTQDCDLCHKTLATMSWNLLGSDGNATLMCDTCFAAFDALLRPRPENMHVDVSEAFAHMDEIISTTDSVIPRT